MKHILAVIKPYLVEKVIAELARSVSYTHLTLPTIYSV